MVREQRRNGPGDEHRQAEHYRAADALRCGDGMAEAEVELVRDEIQVQSSRADHKDQGRHLHEWSGRETSPFRGEDKPNKRHRSVPGTTTSLSPRPANETHCRKQECEEHRVIPSPDTVVDPLTMVVAPVHAIVALLP